MESELSNITQPFASERIMHARLTLMVKFIAGEEGGANLYTDGNAADKILEQ